MANDRIATIVKEINYWKAHKLLPDVYCDFLLALYTRGDTAEVSAQSIRSRNTILTVQMILLVLLLPFSFLVIYSTQFHLILQLGILVLFFSYSCWMAVLLKKNNTIFFQVALVIALLLLLFMSVITSQFLSDYKWLINILLPLNFLIWLLLGYKNHMKYLMFSSIIGLLFTLFFIVL
ncbi:hypothetical protein QGM71_01830 [Virgibacillus sp. C22-A2]|uniref:DUF1700 domain-containing protein n=1 Tax=Virgibacillus tibetensis TaxID=3042313 RepID=A0ABU6KA68_9BACI|nr:hypothetical protein [Virgibacillus sp. C22-A2]